MASDEGARREFDAAYPRLVTASFQAARNFFRFDAGLVEDVVAEAMARAYERWERVRRHQNPTAWVVVCTKNVCLEQLRAKTRRTPAIRESLDDLATIDDHAERHALADQINRALHQLTKRQRDVAVLRYFMDVDEATTAAALGMTVSQVKTAAHEARGRLRVLLANLYGLDEVTA